MSQGDSNNVAVSISCLGSYVRDIVINASFFGPWITNSGSPNVHKLNS